MRQPDESELPILEYLFAMAGLKQLEFGLS